MATRIVMCTITVRKSAACVMAHFCAKKHWTRSCPICSRAFTCRNIGRNKLEQMASKDAQEAEQSATTSSSALRAEIIALNGKIARLTALFVEKDIERSEYLTRKR